MSEIPIIFLVFVLIWVAVIICCRTFSSEDLYLSEGSRRREVLLSQQHALRQVQLPVRRHHQQPHVNDDQNFHVTPVRVTTISRGGGQVGMDFYEIQLPPRQNRTQRNNNNNYIPRQSVVEPPPPPFSTAYLVSSPVIHTEIDPPPPTYEECFKVEGQQTKSKQPVGVTKYSKDMENYI